MKTAVLSEAAEVLGRHADIMIQRVNPKRSPRQAHNLKVIDSNPIPATK